MYVCFCECKSIDTKEEIKAILVYKEEKSLHSGFSTMSISEERILIIGKCEQTWRCYEESFIEERGVDFVGTSKIDLCGRVLSHPRGSFSPTKSP